jgi:hypothetical protein
VTTNEGGYAYERVERLVFGAFKNQRRVWFEKFNVVSRAIDDAALP